MSCLSQATAVMRRRISSRKNSYTPKNLRLKIKIKNKLLLLFDVFLSFMLVESRSKNIYQ